MAQWKTQHQQPKTEKPKRNAVQKKEVKQKPKISATVQSAKIEFTKAKLDAKNKEQLSGKRSVGEVVVSSVNI